MKRAHEESEFSVRRPAMPGPLHQLAGISPHPPPGLTSNHPPPPPPGISHPPPPPGISGPHPPPPGLSSSHPSISGFSHPVLAPTPKQLAHNFEQMRDSLPRPPFSATHITPTSSTNVTAPPPPPPVSHPAPTPPQPSTHPQKPAFQTHIQAPSHNTTAGQQQYQRLKVEDALSYLDQVKLQFGNKPQVYNEFLDIMKEFKSQTIDTPGVISRVSALFKGHIDLIVGFNTFLPPGYKIEVSMTDINTVNVCAPTGTTTHFISGNGLIAAPIQPKPAPVSSSGSSQQASTPPSITTSAGGPPKSPTPLPTLSKTTTSPVTPLLPLTSPSGQSQTQSQAQHHAINYVTKIKIRFQGQPEVYQKFLDILNNYQTEQKAIKENTLDVYGRVCPEQDVYAREGKLATEVYQQVAKLFNKQEDLLQEFSQFLPDATGSSFNPSTMVAGVSSVVTQYQPLSKTKTTTASSSASASKPATGKSKKAQASAKSESVDFDNKENTEKMKKRHKSALKDVSLEEAVKLGSFSDFAFFDKVRKALKSQEVYENFLRCLVLFNSEVISRMELIQLATTFLGKFPELFSWFKGFLGYKDNQQTETNITGFKDRGTGGELAHLEIDFASCKRSGASYRALPKSYTQPKCSGRTALCRELLNDTWVSLPSWSEDTQFPGTRKTQYEEQVYKCEDERFELDVVIEANLTTIKTLEGVQKKMQQMTTDEQNKFKLDNYLGGTSETIHRKAIYRIYGEKSSEIIDGLKKTPGVAIPVVLKRLKQKNEDWRLAQKQFNRIWRDQNEKYYLKSLDHQGINFKQNDLKAIRAKSIIRDIEHIFEERSDQIEDGNAELFGPHITFTYQDQSTLEDASALIIHHMKRQAGIHKEDKTRIKAVLVHSLQQLCFAPRGELSDDEQEEMLSRKHPYPTDDQHYNLFYTNNTWFVLLRMHQMLCERLLKMYKMAMEIAMYETTNRKSRKEQTAVALRLRKPNMTDVEDYYPAFLVMVKNLLDGHLDSNAFEDSLRESFGVNCYIAFTIDKLIQNIVRQLHSLVTEDISLKLYSVYEEAKDNDGSGGPSITTTARASQEMVYQKKVEALLVDENCFKIYFHKEKGTCVTSIELLPTEEDQSEEHAEIEKWSEYVEKYANETEIAEDLKHHLSKKPIFLLRNARVLKRQSKKNKSKRKKHEDTDDDTNDNIVESPVNEDVVVDLKLECKISMNTFKMRYVSGTRDLVFRQSAVGRSRKLHPATNVRLHTAYVPLHEAWLLENTTRDTCHHAEAWFLGKQQPDQLESCLTRKDTLKHGGLNVNKYSVVYAKELKQP